MANTRRCPLAPQSLYTDVRLVAYHTGKNPASALRWSARRPDGQANCCEPIRFRPFNGVNRLKRSATRLKHRRLVNLGTWRWRPAFRAADVGSQAGSRSAVENAIVAGSQHRGP